MDRREFKGKANLKKCILSLDWNIETKSYICLVEASTGVMEQWQKRYFYTKMSGHHIECTELMNQMILRTESEMGKKGYRKDMLVGES